MWLVGDVDTVGAVALQIDEARRDDEARAVDVVVAVDCVGWSHDELDDAVAFDDDVDSCQLAVEERQAAVESSSNRLSFPGIGHRTIIA